MKTLSITLALLSTGLVDRDASIVNAENAIDQYVAERELEEETVGEAVHAVFDKFKGTGINCPALQSLSLQQLNAQPSNWQSLGERVMEYVRGNSQGEKAEDGTYANPTSLFVIAKGKNGGVRRRSDIATPATK